MVFRYPSDPNVNYIKRVVGLPGDSVRYSQDKRLFINGQAVAEQFVAEEPGSLGSAMLYQEKLGSAEHQIRKEMSRYRMMPGHFAVGRNINTSQTHRNTLMMKWRKKGIMLGANPKEWFACFKNIILKIVFHAKNGTVRNGKP